jgi:acyl carrier protein
MTIEELRPLVSRVYAEIFNAPGIVATDELTAQDVDGWDSVSHIDMICGVEDALGVTFSTAEIAGLQNTGELLAVILRKVNA